MSEVSAEIVKKLREKTGAGMMQCKAALAESKGDMEVAIEILRKKGLKDLGKRAGKTAAEGTVGVYVHSGSQVVAMVELNCETDFVARGDDFQSLAKDVAMQVAASKPMYLNIESVPQEILKKEEEILLEQLDEKQKKMADKIIPGRMKKFYEENVLLEQIYVKDESGKKTIRELIQDLSVKTGEKVQIRRFERYQVGEGIEKQSSNFAEDVASMVK